VEIHGLGPELRDWRDTAAVLRELDLVIAVDCSVAHLAGALGQPVWICLPAAPEWRWMLERTDTPWYGTARLFRQPRVGDWGTVFAQVATELRQLVSSGG
jgi:ADP-heptose:LPS heptosyltransferase